MTLSDKPILVTGATGYVGGRLIPRLLDAGYRVRAMARSVDKAACRPWAAHSRAELVQGDVLNRDSLIQAARGCHAAYYLVHSMIAKKRRYADADRRSAQNMAAAAEIAGLNQIIYLGGLGEVDHPSISQHLLSRHEVGRILSSGKVPVTILRAAMILGSGSASFEILRYLVHRLPVMITPRWVRTPSQPIAIGNVIGYLIGCLDHPETRGRTFDIGGPDILAYRDIIDIFAEEAGLPKRRIIPVPLLTPHMSALWIHMVTPVPRSIAVPLTEGLSVPTVCRNHEIQAIVPQDLTPCREAIRAALDKILHNQVDTCWMDAGDVHPPEWAFCGDADWAGGTILECGLRARFQADPWRLWDLLMKLGGPNGYYYGTRLWRLRGWVDRLLGGTGACGRRDTCELMTGDAVDYFRVATSRAPERLMLTATMKVPGEAVLDFEIQPLNEFVTELRVRARFLPRGLGGLAYWYAFYPFHEKLFAGMLKALGRALDRPLVSGPTRFTPRIAPSCTLPS